MVTNARETAQSPDFTHSADKVFVIDNAVIVLDGESAFVWIRGGLRGLVSGFPECASGSIFGARTRGRAGQPSAGLSFAPARPTRSSGSFTLLECDDGVKTDSRAVEGI
ncbi:hypothetical protein GCM10009676_04250 [Prauserella halophila]|uniref:Uncharacterized protein n=1 Tax=Prauserella halophila TaxID=185641 RepID=A0ABP4GPP5_9PSEU|nr:hypothetical protein [Prauserella halophila]MCP2234238.1 hypothetical protein [Prauserella halophila]